MKNFYITTPIYYVNDSPHLGHAYTTIACDVMARFMRLSSNKVKFLTGTDEHGQKIDKAAEKAGIKPQELVDNVSERFKALVNTECIGNKSCKNLLNISNDDFIRTTEERHKKAAQDLWKRLEERGHIYLDKYAGWYSVRDEAYYQESELIDGKAPTGADVEWIEEESYFFNLSKWQDKLLEFYDKNPDFIYPQSRFNEVYSFVKGGLKDLSISRTNFDWGVGVPNATKHVMYVWIDALTNYLTSCGFPNENADQYKDFWQNGEVVHVVGKDILRFHAVYWPAFLMAAELPLPKRIIAHGWWTIEGEKMSKSLGNVISPKELIDDYGLEQVRYFLLKAMPFGNDGDLSHERLIEVCNSDLANNIGNLAQRTLSMIQKNCDGKIPEYSELKDEDKTIFLDKTHDSIKAFNKAFENFEYNEAINSITRLASAANEYIDEQAPWVLKKENPNRMGEVLYVLAETTRIIAILLQPFCPEASSKLLNQLSILESERNFNNLTAEFSLKSGKELPKPEGVFPRIEVK